MACAALAEPAVRLVVISGPGGAGKSALAQAALADPAGAALLAGAGRFAPHNLYGAAPLVAAVDDALSHALESLFDPEAALDTLAASLDDTARAFAGLSGGPLGELAGRAADVSGAVGVGAAAERLAQALVAVCGWLAGLKGGVLLVLDDWGRGGRDTAGLVRRLVQDVPTLRILATERTEEPFEPAPSVRAVRVELAALPPAARRAVAADLLEGDRRAAAEVAELLGDAAGLPFDLAQSVAALTASGALRRTERGWKLDRARAVEALGGTVAEALASRLAEAGAGAIAVARTLALFGDAAAPDDLAAASGLSRDETEAALARLAGLGLVSEDREGVRFSHDRIQAAVLAGMDRGAQAAGAERLAESLRAAGVRPAALGRGAAMLDARLAAGDDRADPGAWSPLFVAGAGQARVAGAGGKASEWAGAALRLARRAGRVSPEVLREAVYAAVERGDFAAGRELAEEMLAVSTGPRAVAEADEMRALVRRAAGDIEGALAVAREALARVGQRLPAQVGLPSLVATAFRVLTADVAHARRKGRLSPEELEIYAPLMRALNAAGSLLFEKEPMRAMVLAVSGVPHRLAEGTASGAAAYSVLCAAFGAFRRGEKWAQLSDELQWPGQPMRAMAMQYSTNFGFAQVRPRASAGARVTAMERMAYAEGDLPVAAYANRRRALDTVLGGEPLPAMAAKVDACLAIARRLADQPTLVTVEALREFVAALAEPRPVPWRLDGAFFDAAAFARSPLAATTHAPRHIHVLEAQLCALFGAWEAGAALYERTRGYFKPPALQLLPQAWFFPTALALYRTGRRPPAWRMAVLGHHARHNPTDHGHRLKLLEAEALRVQGRPGPALERYEEALHAARTSGCGVEHALVAAAAAGGAEMLGAGEAARRHRAERDAAWRRLGAAALLAHHGLAPDRPPTVVAEDASGAALRELELNSAREAAERASRAKSRLLAEVAHELRTPLQGAVELLSSPGAAPADPDALRETLRHLSTVVDDLADMGALEAGGLSLARAPFDPRRTVEQVCAMHSAQAGPRPVQILAAEGPVLLGDEVRVRQIVSNLLANALKHGEGAVSVALRCTAVKAGAELTVEVADEGPGLPEAALATVFEPFRRGPDTEAEGLGLGLPIARRLARAMGGDLTARVQAGKTVFSFQVRLPVASPGMGRPRRPGPRVLLAEDVDLSRRVLARLLVAEGCEVHEASDGPEALAIWGSRPVDLVITDQRMPGMTGAELSRQLRAGGFAGRIAIAAGADDAELQAQAQGLADVVILRKPVDRARLSAWLDSGREIATAFSPVAVGRIAELLEALGPAAAPVFAELPGETDALLAEVLAALKNGEGPAVAAASHRLAGLAEHFGLEEVAAEARRLEQEARGLAVLSPAAAQGAEAALQAARARLDWSAFAMADA